MDNNPQKWSWIVKAIRALQDSIEFESSRGAGRETKFRAQGVLLVVAAATATTWYFLHR